MHIGTGTIGYPLLRATFISKERAHAPYIPYNFYINSFIRLNFNSSMTMTYMRSQPNFVSQEQSLDLVKTVAKCVCGSDGRLFGSVWLTLKRKRYAGALLTCAQRNCTFTS